MAFTFTSPIWLLLIAPGVAAAWWLTRRQDLFAGMRIGLFLLRAAVVVAGAAALAGPVRYDPQAGPALIFGIDLSDSYRAIAGDPRTVLADALAGWQPPDDLRTAVVAFGAEPVVVRPLGTGLPTGAEWDRTRLDTRSTDLDSALRTMRSLAPAAGDVRLVLFSDGRQTIPRAAGPEPPRASAESVTHRPVYVWAGGLPPSVDARVAALRLPARLAPGQTLTGSVVVVCNRNAGAAVRITRFRAGGGSAAEVAVLPVSLTADEPALLGFTDRPDGAGVWTYRVELVGADRRSAWRDVLAENDALSASVTVGDPRSLLVITRSPDGALAQACRARTGISVKVVSPAAMPASAAELSAYETVVLDNLPTDRAPKTVLDTRPAAELLTAERVAALAGYVESFGGGLIVMGGGESFGPGGYHLSPINLLLPVDSDPRSRNPTALALVFDRSGSMDNPASKLAGNPGGKTRIGVVREAVMALAPPVLNQRDELAVIGFNDKAKVLRPLAPGADAPALSSCLAGENPQGGTACLKAIQSALDELKTAKSETKRILLITDGESDDLNEQKTDAAAKADRARIRNELLARKIRLSVVVAGGERSPALEELAAATGGRAYTPADFTTVPDRLLEDLYVSGDFVRSGAIAIRAGDVGPFPALAALPTLPPLERLVRTVVKPDATAALSAEGGDPVLAYRNSGLGRVAALPFSAEGDWAGAWRGRGIELLVGSVLDWTMRPPTDPDWDWSAEVTGDRVRLELLSTRRPPANELHPVVRFAGPEPPAPVTLVQTGPGRYTAALTISRQGTYSAAVETGGSAPRLLRTGFTTGHRAEIAEIGFAEAPLTRLAEGSGGKFLFSMAELTDWGRAVDAGAESLAGWAVAAMMAFASLELLLRIALRKGWI